GETLPPPLAAFFCESFLPALRLLRRLTSRLLRSSLLGALLGRRLRALSTIRSKSLRTRVGLRKGLDPAAHILLELLRRKEARSFLRRTCREVAHLAGEGILAQPSLTSSRYLLLELSKAGDADVFALFDRVLNHAEG